MPDKSKFEKILKIARRYQELGMGKSRAIKKAKQELKKRSYHINNKR